MRIKAYGIIINGNKEFCEQTKQALDLLKAKDSHNFGKVRKFFRYIIQSKVSGTPANPKVFFVSLQTAFPDPHDKLYSLIWYAASIVHDAIHVELARRFNHADPKNVERYELLCCGFQINCLKKIGGDPRHFHAIEETIKSRYRERTDGW